MFSSNSTPNHLVSKFSMWSSCCFFEFVSGFKIESMISQSLRSVFSCFFRPLLRGISLCAAWVFQQSPQSVIEQRLHQDKICSEHSQSSHKGDSDDPRAGDCPPIASDEGLATTCPPSARLSWSCSSGTPLSSKRLKNEASSSPPSSFSSSSSNESSSETSDEDLLLQFHAVSDRKTIKHEDSETHMW